MLKWRKKGLPAKTGHVCKQHDTKQTVFCDEENCQVLLCPTCILVKHMGHKLVDIPDKAEQVRDELRKLKINTINKKDNFTRLLERMHTIKEVVNTSASKALTELDKAKSKALQELENAMNEVKREAETEKVKITKNQQMQLKEVEIAIVDLKEKRAEIEECVKLIMQFIEAEDAIDVILNKGIVS